MADDKFKTGSGTTGGKRPYATIDVKAKEIRVTPITDKPAAEKPVSAAEVPTPSPAHTYATSEKENAASAASASNTAATASLKAASSNAGGASKGTPSKPAAGENNTGKRGGGFFSHLAAGIAGGILAVGGAYYALPHLGAIKSAGVEASDALSNRLAELEAAVKKRTESAPAGIDQLQTRIAELEKAAAGIPALAENQQQLVADTKAALASAASDSGAPQYVTRLAKLEDQLKSLQDAGANNPNAGRLEQVAALTGKVSDLETALSTQLTELRKSVSGDVEARLASATEASEAAKSGTQRLDRDIAALRSESVAYDERLKDIKTESDRNSANVKTADEKITANQSAIEALSKAAAKPADIAAAVDPMNGKIAGLEQRVDDVLKTESERRASAANVLLALQLQDLKRALDRGESFATELAEVRKAAGDKIDLAALEKVKDTGIATASKLAADFRTAANAAIDADQEPADGGVVDRLWAGAKSIVRVRKIDHDAGDTSTEAVVGRMEVALKQDRLEDVLTESKALSPKAQDAARPFLDAVAARASVETALASLENQLKSTLAPGPSEPAEAAP